MDIHGRALSEGHLASIETAGDAALVPVTEVALEIPVRMARIVVALFHAGWSVPGRDGIGVPPMSGDWLRDFAEDSGKHDDLF